VEAGVVRPRRPDRSDAGDVVQRLDGAVHLVLVERPADCPEGVRVERGVVTDVAVELLLKETARLLCCRLVRILRDVSGVAPAADDAVEAALVQLTSPRVHHGEHHQLPGGLRLDLAEQGERRDLLARLLVEVVDGHPVAVRLDLECVEDLRERLLDLFP